MKQEPHEDQDEPKEKEQQQEKEKKDGVYDEAMIPNTDKTRLRWVLTFTSLSR
jgi:hypothetical protein